MGKLVKQLELEALGPTFSRPSPSAYAMLCYAKSLQSCPTLCDPIDGSPLQCSCLENPRDGGAWWTAVYGVAQSRTRLK